MNKGYYKIGFIMKPHGLKGEVTVSPDFDSATEWGKLKSVFVQKKGDLVPYFIEQAALRNNKVYLKFEDVSSLTEAKALQKLSLFLPLKQRPKLQRGNFYNDEVIGFEVIDKQAGGIGIVKAVERANANRFLIIGHNQREVMIPVNGPFISSINKSKKKIEVNLPEGFMDI